MRCSIGPAWVPQFSVKYRKMYFVDSVLPAPDSPLTMTDWLTLVTFMSRYALSAAKSKYSPQSLDLAEEDLSKKVIYYLSL